MGLVFVIEVMGMIYCDDIERFVLLLLVGVDFWVVLVWFMIGWLSDDMWVWIEFLSVEFNVLRLDWL